jgi:hypothetical protein
MENSGLLCFTRLKIRDVEAPEGLLKSRGERKETHKFVDYWREIVG